MSAMSYITQQRHWRGRGNWRGYQRGSFRRPQLRVEQELPELPMGPLIDEFEVNVFTSDSIQYKPIARITNCTIVASWNWTNATAPEMLIPGKLKHQYFCTYTDRL